MVKTSFADLKGDFDDACEFLQSFARGRRGFTPQDGVAGAQRMSEVCARLKRLFASGPHAEDAAAAATAGKNHIAAAEARLALLRDRN
jgi:hypothetical protein